MATVLGLICQTAISGVSSLETKIRELAASSAGTDNVDSTTYLKLQQMSSEYQMAMSTSSAAMKSVADAMQGVIQKIS